jgi:putative transposase
VSNRGNCGQRVFHDDSDFLSFLELLKEAKNLHSMRIMAYCLMPDHFHLLLSPERGGDLSKFM